ncbi:PaaI family thioesterase [Pseudogemmobacter sp. W21_MBD1_M6]|uniref:PaaI family thioesterase n=1 Tax=Pseudogemmobacter sp. W21_MBD1_M6 TaxID=3240271 RepID=UPI003F9D49EE
MCLTSGLLGREMRRTNDVMEKELGTAGWHLDPDDGFIGHVGGLWRREVNGQQRFAFVARAIHANRNGAVHGGMLMTFVDRVMGQTARLSTGAVRGATISLNHQFLAPVRIGDLVEMTPQITQSTTRMVFLTGTAFVGAAPVASAQGVWRVSHSA